MDCTFRTIGPDVHRCTACGFVVSTPHPPARIHRACEASDPSEVHRLPPDDSVAADIKAYLINGQAGATAVEIERRLAVCRSCDYFTGDNCCKLCTSCASAREWIWALVGFEGFMGGGREIPKSPNPQIPPLRPDCPLKKWDPPNQSQGRPQRPLASRPPASGPE